MCVKETIHPEVKTCYDCRFFKWPHCTWTSSPTEHDLNDRACYAAYAMNGWNSEAIMTCKGCGQVHHEEELTWCGWNSTDPYCDHCLEGKAIKIDDQRLHGREPVPDEDGDLYEVGMWLRSMVNGHGQFVGIQVDMGESFASDLIKGA